MIASLPVLDVLDLDFLTGEQCDLWVDDDSALSGTLHWYPTGNRPYLLRADGERFDINSGDYLSFGTPDRYPVRLPDPAYTHSV